VQERIGGGVSMATLKEQIRAIQKDRKVEFRNEKKKAKRMSGAMPGSCRARVDEVLIDTELENGAPDYTLAAEAAYDWFNANGAQFFTPAAISAEKWPGTIRVDPVKSCALLATRPGLIDVRASVASVSTVGVGGNASPWPPGATHRSARSPPNGSASTTIVGSGVETPSANDDVVDPGAPRSQHTAISISPAPRRPLVRSPRDRPR